LYNYLSLLQYKIDYFLGKVYNLFVPCYINYNEESQIQDSIIPSDIV